MASDEETPSSVGTERVWTFCGKATPRSEIVFFCQIIVLYTVVVTSIYNLTAKPTSSDKALWSGLLCSCLGYLLPNPKIKRQLN